MNENGQVLFMKRFSLLAGFVFRVGGLGSVRVAGLHCVGQCMENERVWRGRGQG